MTVLLRARGIAAAYGERPVVHGVDIDVDAGEVVVLLGANGVGKSTTLMALSGALTPTAGTIEWRGRRTRAPLHRRCRDGLSLVTEERSIVASLTASENLRVGRCDASLALRLFPELEPHLGTRAGLLSGGEQQMLTLARALARRPAVLMADELSLGLAPLMVTRLLRVIRESADAGLGVLLVEQHVRRALAIADRAYVMSGGTAVDVGRPVADGSTMATIEEIYLSHAPAPAGGPT